MKHYLIEEFVVLQLAIVELALQKRGLLFIATMKKAAVPFFVTGKITGAITRIIEG